MKQLFWKLSTLVVLANCTAEKSSPTQSTLVKEIHYVQVKEEKELLNHVSDGVQKVEVTFDKALLNQDFLYGADLQHSAMGDAELGLFLQSMAMGHFIAKFRVVGDQLQVLASGEHAYESDINHPDTLLQQFPIISQNENQIKVVISQASPALEILFFEKRQTGTRSYLRSFQFVEKDNLLLMETTIENAKGEAVYVMESLFPRKNLVPNSETPIFADPQLEPLAQRFRFLGNGPIFMNLTDVGRVKTQVATRFSLEKNPNIDWYMTSNTPEAYQPLIKTGLEAWNRYFNPMLGRDVVQLKGELPKDVRLGDPRYNVIVWDYVQEAGAAYETQAADPLTGIQSHSMVYLPYAWFNIGQEFWKSGSFTEIKKKSARKSHLKFLGREMKPNCSLDISQKFHLLRNQNPEEFGKALLKGVVFHEVGHALGLAHNFKASLSWDHNQETSPVTYSVMDYNQFHLEHKLFDSLEAATGPVLEYDRQILSVLYNQAKDISEEDPVIPTCDDEEADSTKGGVDPLCVRYDAGHNPTELLQAMKPLILETQGRAGSTQSLSEALRAYKSSLPSTENVKSLEDLMAAMEDLVGKLRGTIAFYYTGGAQSLANMTATQIRILRTFKPQTLPFDYDAMELRTAARENIAFALAQDSLSVPAILALDDAMVELQQWFLKTPAFANLDGDLQNLVSIKLGAVIASTKTVFVNSMLDTLKASLVNRMKRIPTAPFFKNESVDYEKDVLGILNTLLSEKNANQANRSLALRLAVAKILVSYKDIPEAAALLANHKEALSKEIENSKTAERRESLRLIQKTLEGTPTSPQGSKTDSESEDEA